MPFITLKEKYLIKIPDPANYLKKVQPESIIPKWPL